MEGTTSRGPVGRRPENCSGMGIDIGMGIGIDIGMDMDIDNADGIDTPASGGI